MNIFIMSKSKSNGDFLLQMLFFGMFDVTTMREMSRFSRGEIETDIGSVVVNY